MRFYIPNRFAGSSTIGFYEQATGNRWHIMPDGTVKQIIGVATTSQATGQTWTVDDAIDFEIVDVSGSKRIKVSKNGAAIVTCAGAMNGGFYVYAVIYSEDTIGQVPSANVTYKRPDPSGTGITSWRQGVAAINIVVPPTAGFTMGGTLQASETLSITDDSVNALTYEWSITNSAYADTVVSTSADPNLTRYLRMGTNTIKQTVTNSSGSDDVSDTVIVSVKTITNIDALEYTLTGLSDGVVLIGKVKATDSANTPNVSDWSNTDTITV